MRKATSLGVRAGWTARCAIAALVAPAVPAAVAAQDGRPDAAAGSVVTVAAGPQYRAGWLHRLLFGEGYRELWALPIEVPVLDLAGFAGGLRPVERGGGMQTRSLRFRSADGRQFRFRSLDKNTGAKFPEHLRRTLVAGLYQDATSAMHPGGPLAAAEFLEAVDVPHPTPRLVVLPDDEALGEFREEFGGMLGTLEAFPDEGRKGRPGFAGFHRVTGTDKLIERLNERAGEQVDARRYLAVRLVDMLLNDWDRHPGQWRWGAREDDAPDDGEVRRWVPIPVDRDYVFVGYGGLLPSLARRFSPNMVDFEGTYRLAGLTEAGLPLDRRLLAGLDRAAWDSVVAHVRARITDDVITRALERMPDEYREHSGTDVAARLRLRLAALPAAAGAWYAQLARAVDVHASDEAETARVEYETDGAVTVTLAAAGRETFRRRFLPGETEEVRLYLHGGDDSALVRGRALDRSPHVRLIGGEGTNRFVDSSRAAGRPARRAPVTRYDAGATRRVTYGPDSLVEAMLDRRPWPRWGGRPHEPPPDHGLAFAPVPRLRYASGMGLVAGLDLSLVRYGFRRVPYAQRLVLGADRATGIDASRFRLGLDMQGESSRLYVGATLVVSELEQPRFHGLGNATPEARPDSFYALDQRRIEAAFEVGRRGGRGVVALGPFVRRVRTRAGPDAPVGAPTVRGAGETGLLGLRLRAAADTRDDPVWPATGLSVSAEAALLPQLWDLAGTVGTAGLAVSGYLPVPLPPHPVLALRAGARRAWGPYPYFEAATLGGERTLRGYDEARYAGDAALFGGAELRFALFTVPALLGEFGVHGLAEAGRVWVDGRSPGGWHEAFGGGAWFTVLDRATTISVTAVRGEERTHLYVRGGFGF